MSWFSSKKSTVPAKPAPAPKTPALTRSPTESNPPPVAPAPVQETPAPVQETPAPVEETPAPAAEPDVPVETDAQAQAEGFKDESEREATMKEKKEEDSIQVQNIAAMNSIKAGDYASAETSLKACIALKEKDNSRGPSHPDTLLSVSRLARVYELKKDFAQCETQYQRVVDAYVQTLGVAHLSTIAAINGLALAKSQQGKFADAEQLFQQALEGKQTLFASEEVSVRTAYNNVGYVDCSQKKYKDAEIYFTSASGIEDRNSGVEVKVKARDNLDYVKQQQKE